MSKSFLRLRIEHFLRCCISSFYATFCHAILVKGFFSEDGLSLINANFGDDINIPLLRSISGRKIVLWRNCFFNENKKNIIAIGSILEFNANMHSYVWGSGAMFGNKELREKPFKVCAVRGKLSRQYLLNQGIDCPEVYGDPALLLPYIYKCNSVKKFKYGIVPHILDYDLPHVVKFREEHPEVLFIRLNGYKNWQDVIDKINSCEFILSSSLHGLIVSDAYGVPNARVLFSNLIEGGDFKYKDYYSGVDRKYVDPIDFREIINIQNAAKYLNEYVRPVVPVKELVEAFPLSLSPTFSKLLNS